MPTADPRGPAHVPRTRSGPWNLRRVVHLHRRAGFAATWSDMTATWRMGRRQRRSTPARQGGAAGRARRLLCHCRRAWQCRGGLGDPGRLKAWWLYRMLFGPDPLTRTADAAVAQSLCHQQREGQRLAAMQRQNEVLLARAGRRSATCSTACPRSGAARLARCPANRKGHPNENLAREMMELFTLGIGHYTETTSRRRPAPDRLGGGGRLSVSRTPRHDAGDRPSLARPAIGPATTW